MKKLLLNSMLLLCALIVGSGTMWADETITLTATNLNLSTSGSYPSGEQTETVGGISFKYTDLMRNNATDKYIQAKASTGCIYNSTAFPSKIKSVAITHSGTARSTTILGSADGKDWTSIKTGSGSITGDFTGGSYYYFKITRGSNAAYWPQVVITYETTHTLTYSATNGSISGLVYNTSTAVASGASVAEGGKVTLTATPASGYAFKEWSVEGTGSTLSSTSTNPTTFTMGTANSTVTAVFEESTTVDNPKFTVPEGTYNAAQSVELNCTTDGATIYYTTDGTDPTSSSTEYTGAISVNATTTIKAFAVKAGLTNSGIASATYTLKCVTPTITVPAGVFLDSKVVTMTATDGSTIYYTTDGSTPTSSSTTYDPSSKPSISATTTFKAIAIKVGWSNSEVATETFTKIVPLTVAEAKAAIDAASGTTGVYVRGHITKIDSYDDSKYITYWIADDGLATDAFEVYKGLGIDGASFSAASDLTVGDEVVITGDLQKFSSTYEFKKDNQLVNRITKTIPTFTLDVSEKTLDAYTKESVDVELTTNTDAGITCISSNEDVATVALKSGNVYTITAVTDGSATITIKSAPSATYAAAKATVAITVEDERAEAGISFAEDSEEITWGDSYTTQTLTNGNSVAVVWSSTDEEVATVDENNGAITVLKAGETDIKATFAGNATYKAAIASYTLTVNKANAGLSYDKTVYNIRLDDGTFEAPTLNNPNGLTVTYASNNTDVALVDENTGALTYEESAVGTAKITATFAGNDRYKAGSANYTINIVDPLVKGSVFNPYTVEEVNTGNYSGNNYVTGYIVGYFNGSASDATTTGTSSTVANVALSDSPSEIGGANTIAVQLPSGTIRDAWNIYQNAVIGYKVLVYGNITGYFTNKTGVKNTSEISAVTAPISTASGKNYSTYVTAYDLDFSTVSSDIKAYVAASEAEGSKITFTGKDAVPAGTPILIKTTTAGATVNVPVAATTPDAVGTNKLVAGTGSAITYDSSASHFYYILSNGEFRPANNSVVATGKAYLSLDGAAGARGLSIAFDDDETTAIETVVKTQKTDGMYFDLQGRMIVQPTKGLYIVNGRKVVIK